MVQTSSPASTAFSQYETEPRTIAAVRNEGYTLDLTQSLYFDHWADGYVDPDTGIDVVPEMRVEVGRLTRNVIVQGDHIYSKKEQFGVQIVLRSDGDESLIGRFSNVEVRETGQGMKLGKCAHGAILSCAHPFVFLRALARLGRAQTPSTFTSSVMSRNRTFSTALFTTRSTAPSPCTA